MYDLYNSSLLLEALHRVSVDLVQLWNEYPTILGRRTGSIGRRPGGTRSQHIFHHRIERAARRALDAEKVPLSIGALNFTIVANDIDRALQIGRHGVLHNIPRSRLPGGRHALLRNDRFLANRTAIVKAGQFAKAVGVNGVSARQILRRLARSEHVLATDRTIVLVFVLEAVAVKYSYIYIYMQQSERKKTTSKNFW
jgi:hypothetical protein